MTGSSGKGVDLEIYFKRKGLEHAFLVAYARVVFLAQRPQVRDAILETRLEVQRHSLRKHCLRFAGTPSLRGDVNLQAEGNEMLVVPEDYACEFEVIRRLGHTPYLQGTTSALRRQTLCIMFDDDWRAGVT